MPGRHVVAERFELVSRAGAGGMGEVWRAVDRVTGENAALKLVLDGGRDAERFAREARVLAELRHPAIVRYLAHGTAPDGVAWLAMEWLEGRDLASRLADGGLTSQEAIDLVRRTAEALGVAHARGIVHRDVKPANIMLVGNDAAGAKLLDFGIARADALARQRTMGAMTRTGVAIGTPGYMAPEQARGEREIDARADVFSLGCVLYECLTGVPPFAGEHAIATLAKILLEDPKPLDQVLAGAPAPLVDLVARMLAKDRARRPADGRTVAHELSALGRLPSLRATSPIDRPPALTDSEQRMLSVVLVVTDHAVTNAATVTNADDATVANVDGQVFAQLVRLAGSFRGELHVIAGGTVLCAFAGSTEATESAARFALAAAKSGARVGLSTGRARVERSQPMGAAIDQAVTLARHATAGTVAIDERTAQTLTGRFATRSAHGSIVLLDTAHDSVPTYNLLGKATRCVGRERDLTLLDSFWTGCIEDGRPRPLLFVAPPGTGKTRLVAEFIRRLKAREDNAEIWIARADPMSAGSPLRMLSDAVKRSAGIRDDDALDERREKLRARVALRSPANADRVAEFLGEMIGTPFLDDASPQLRAARADVRVMADQVRRAWEEYIVEECAAQPLLLVLEDLHWGDAATVSFLDSAMRVASESPWMILALARPTVNDVFPDLWRSRGLQELRLEGLSRKASEVLIRDALGERADAATIRVIVSRADGNAFFLEELIRAAAAGKSDAVPETVLASVEARLGELDAETRRVVRAASVLGGTFWSGAVHELLGASGSTSEIDACMALLVERELIVERPSRLSGQREYAFRHDLVRQAAYGMLLDADRALGHRLAAEWLERVGERDALTIAEHYEKGGELRPAAAAYLRAARQADEADDLEGAIARAERGVACGATGETLGALRLVQGYAQLWRGRRQLSAECARDAVQVLEEGTIDWFDAVDLALTSAHYLVVVQDVVLNARKALAARPKTAEAGVRRLRALARAALFLVQNRQNDEAEPFLAETQSVQDPLARARVVQAFAFAQLAMGDVAGPLENMREAERIFDQAGIRRNAVLMRVNIASLLAQVGDYEQAAQACRDALSDSRRVGLEAQTRHALANLASIHLQCGRVEEANVAATEALTGASVVHDPRFRCATHGYLAEVKRRMGDLGAARAEAVRALEALQTPDDVRSASLAELARIELACGNVDAARKAIDEAAEGAVQSASSVGLVRVEVLRRVGDHEAARRVLIDVRNRLLARAAMITDAEMRESFLSRVPDHAAIFALCKELGVSAEETSTSP